MKKLIKVSFTVLASLVISLTAISPASAQFSKAVVMLKGNVRFEQTGKPCSVKVSILSEDKSSEINSGRSNSESGDYLIVLQPNKKYWVRVSEPGIVTREDLIETPSVKATVQIYWNINLTENSDPNAQQEKAIIK
jgi:hypothetical protein